MNILTVKLITIIYVNITPSIFFFNNQYCLVYCENERNVYLKYFTLRETTLTLSYATNCSERNLVI